jgi:hypothetical protein
MICVATGLWTVRDAYALIIQNGPQGRGYKNPRIAIGRIYAVPLPSPAPNWIPCASGSSVEKLIVFVWRRM